MARDRLPTRIHRNGARMYNPKGIGEWVEKQGGVSTTRQVVRKSPKRLDRVLRSDVKITYI